MCVTVCACVCACACVCECVSVIVCVWVCALCAKVRHRAGLDDLIPEEEEWWIGLMNIDTVVFLSRLVIFNLLEEEQMRLSKHLREKRPPCFASWPVWPDSPLTVFFSHELTKHFSGNIEIDQLNYMLVNSWGWLWLCGSHYGLTPPRSCVLWCTGIRLCPAQCILGWTPSKPWACRKDRRSGYLG